MTRQEDIKDFENDLENLLDKFEDEGLFLTTSDMKRIIKRIFDQ